MSRSRDNADAVTTVPSGVGRNMIINGGTQGTIIAKLKG